MYMYTKVKAEPKSFLHGRKKFAISAELYGTSINFKAIFVVFFFLSLHQSPSESDLMFHFFGVESDSTRVREAINKMVEKGRIGNFSLVSTHYALHQEPGLVLQVRAIYYPSSHPLYQRYKLRLFAK